MRVLDIWMNGLLVGQWHQQGRTASRLVYAPSWVGAYTRETIVTLIADDGYG